MRKTGELLRQEREKRGLSLHEIGMSLKINPKTLQSIEDGDVSKLPQKTFLRGFVKSYAAYLKMDVNSVLALFTEEMGPVSPPPPVVTPPPVVSVDKPSAPEAEVKVLKTEPAKPKPSAFESSDITPSFNPVAISMAIGAFFVLVGVYKLVDKYSKERHFTNTAVESTQEQKEESVLSESTAALSPQVPSAPMTPAAPVAPAVIPTAPMTTKIVSPSIPSVKPVAAVVPTAPSQPQKQPKPEAAQIPESPVEVIVEATGKVSIKYLFGGESEKTIELESGQVHTFKSKKGISLDISDGGLVSLIVNGRDKGAAGPTGKSVKLSYPK